MTRAILLVAMVVGCTDPSDAPGAAIGLPAADFLGDSCDLSVSICREANPTAHCVDEDGTGAGVCRPECDLGICHGTTQGGVPTVIDDVCVCLPE